MPSAVASHILVSTEEKAIELKQLIDSGTDFAELAKEHSSCPSGKAGGSLGQFRKGDMVPEFDAVIFSEIALGDTSGPVKTQFGYHLIQVQQRMM